MNEFEIECPPETQCATEDLNAWSRNRLDVIVGLCKWLGITPKLFIRFVPAADAVAPVRFDY